MVTPMMKFTWIGFLLLFLASLVTGIVLFHDVEVSLIMKLGAIGLFSVGVPFLFWLPLRLFSAFFLKRAKYHALRFPNLLVPGKDEPFGYIRRTRVNLFSALSPHRFVAMNRYYSALSDLAHRTHNRKPININFRMERFSEDGKDEYIFLFYLSDTVLNTGINTMRVGNSAEGYQLLTNVIKLYQKKGYGIHDYADLLMVMYKHFDMCYRINDSHVWSSHNTVHALNEYIKAFADDDNGFTALSIEEQWDSVAEIGSAEMSESIMVQIAYEKAYRKEYDFTLLKVIRAMISTEGVIPEDTPDLIFSWSDDGLSLEITDTIDLTRVLSLSWDNASDVPDEEILTAAFHYRFKDTY